MKTIPIILASASPERAAILKSTLNFDVKPADINETPLENENAEALVERLAIQKAQFIHSSSAHTISADTIIEFDGENIGKPKNKNHAKNTILKLMGKVFNVWTSTVILLNNNDLCFKTEAATLTLKVMNDTQLEIYLNSNIWVGKAGAFSINDPNCPAKIIKGDLDSVRGISLSFINDTLSKMQS